MLREPLFHFLLLGGGLFLLYAQVSPPRIAAEGSTEIVVTEGRLLQLESQYEKAWRRPPTAAELEELVEEFLREEIFYREALALGLEQDDTVIRRRLRQKMEFLAEDLASLAEPTEEDLQEYFQDHVEEFSPPSSFTFQHVYFQPGKEAVAKELLQRLESGEQLDYLQEGDQFLLERAFVDVPQEMVSRSFGEDFAVQLSVLESGRWHGPIRSGFGVHLVFLEKVEKTETPTLEEFRPEVQREWLHLKRKEMNEAFFQQLREKYTVTRS